MSGGGGARVSIVGGLKKMIQDIREIAGEHSDEDIYAMLKECSMDPNETTQRLLHLDTFHEVKKKHGKRKENVVIKASDGPGKQLGARVSRGAKVGGGSFHSQNSPQTNPRRNFGGSKENGFPNTSKGHKSENKITHEGSRLVHAQINRKSTKDEAPQSNAVTVSSAGHDPLSDIVKSDETSVLADGGPARAAKLMSASFSVKQENVSSAENHVDSAAPVIQINSIATGNTVHENQYSMTNGNANWSNDKISTSVHHTEIVDAAKIQPTDFNSNDLACQAKGVAVNCTVDCEEKRLMSEEDISVLNDAVSKLSVPDVSDGHVVFPEHLQVPEAYKKKLTFGSFGSTWPLDAKHTSDDSAKSSDNPMPTDESYLVKTVAKPSTESGSISSTVQDFQDIENQTHLQSTQPISNNTSLVERTSPDLVIKIDEPETESQGLLQNGGPVIAYHPSNNVFGFAAKSQRQVHDSAEPQVGSFITSSTSGVDQSYNIQPPGVAHDSISPPPGPFLRQTYHPSLFPYGHYYPQFIAPQVQQYVTHSGFPHQHQPLVPNVYLTSPVAGGIKYPHQQQKQGSNAGTDSYIGVPSGYNPYGPYAFPYGLPPAVVSGSVPGDDVHADQIKDNGAISNEQQTESSGEWMAASGRTVPGMQINPFYNLAPGHGHPMVFPPTPAGFGPFGGIYHHPLVQTIPAHQPTMHSHSQQSHLLAPAEPPPPPPAFYQQPQPQGAHILRSNNKQ